MPGVAFTEGFCAQDSMEKVQTALVCLTLLQEPKQRVDSIMLYHTGIIFSFPHKLHVKHLDPKIHHSYMPCQCAHDIQGWHSVQHVALSRSLNPGSALLFLP